LLHENGYSVDSRNKFGEGGGPAPAPDTYTHGHQDAVLRSHRWRTAANSASYLTPHLRAGMRLLDVGCGPGTLTVDLARLVAPGEVVGIDIAAGVVAEAAAYAHDAGVENVSFVAGDFRDVDGGFDVVHAHQVLQHLRDPVGALRRMRALAAPGGLVAARDSDYSAMTWSPASPPLDRWREIYLAVTSRNGADADAGRHLAAWAADAGFDPGTTKSSASAWTFTSADDRQWWGELWAERSTSSSFATQAVEYGIATAAELADVAAGWRAWAAAPAGEFVVPHGEILATA
jgi:SAM-dependent methyltransferase